MSRQSPLPKSLNICIVARKFPIKSRAAANGFLWPIARGLSQKGHRVTFISNESPQNQHEFNQDNVSGYYISEGPLRRFHFSRAVYIKFLELHKKDPFHIIHSIDASAIKVAQTKKRSQLAVAYDIQATQIAQLFAILGMAKDSLGSLLRSDLALVYKYLTTFFRKDRKILKTADGVFVTSPQQRLILERYYYYPDSRIYTVPYGVEIGDISQMKDTDNNKLKESLNLPEAGHTIVSITDMTELEEIKNLLHAFEKVAIKKPKSRLILVGNGPRRKDIEYHTYNLALGSKVIFTGSVRNVDLSKYISLADVFVNLSSRTTGFEPSMLEAMAQKKVVIGSEVSAISNIIEDGIDGFLIRPADTQSLSHLLIAMFTGRLITSKIGDKACKKVMDLFDTEKMVNETIASYFKILKRSGHYSTL